MTAEREAMTERQAFEQWATSMRVYPIEREESDPNVYRDVATHEAWVGWRACIKHLSRAAEPAAWLFTCIKPGKRIQFSSVDPDTTEHCPLDQWTTIEKEPLVRSQSPEPARDAKRLDAIDEWTAAGRRIEFAKSLYSAGVEIGLHEPINAFARNSVREAIDAAMAQEGE